MMRILSAMIAALIVSACATKPQPTFMDPTFEKSTASRIVLLPLVDQRSDKDRADNPDAAAHFSGALSDSILWSGNQIEMSLHHAGYVLVDTASSNPMPAASQNAADTLYLQLALTSYHSIPALDYSVGCSGELKEGDQVTGQTVWKNVAQADINALQGLGPLMYGLNREGAFQTCIAELLSALPDRDR